ncbi:MAG: tmk, partial [Anaerolineales bacterium]|nr:tmk [Anaerolineales bacterium]
NRLDAYNLEFHQRVRQGYLALAAADPKRWLTVDASQPAEAVQAEIRRLVEKRLGPPAA